MGRRERNRSRYAGDRTKHIINSKAYGSVPYAFYAVNGIRAIGVSKRNISNVFNAETFIIGAMAGLLGIVITYILLIPATVIALMMIAFNLFGNGLRDAFNPSLRGADD